MVYILVKRNQYNSLGLTKNKSEIRLLLESRVSVIIQQI